MSGGTVYPRKDRPGLWYWELRKDGKRLRRSYPSKEAADAAKAAYLRGVQPAGSLGDWLTEWLDQYVPHRQLAPKTRDTYASIVRNQWMPQPIARRPIGTITSDDVEAALWDMWDWKPPARRINRTTVEHARAVLSGAMTAAVKAGIIGANPVRTTKLPGSRVTPRVRTLRLTEQVAHRITDAVHGTPVAAQVMILLHTGMRPAECLALKAEDVDLDRRAIHVHKAVQALGPTWVIGGPKTPLSVRTILYAPELHPLLVELCEARPHGYLFPSARKGAAYPDNPVRLAHQVRPIFDAAGLEDYSPRDLRSLHASLLLAGGATIEEVSARLGHGQITTTYTRYIGIEREEDREGQRFSIWRSKE